MTLTIHFEDTGLFPKEYCIKPNTRELGVFDSDVDYLCVIVDDRFPLECRIKTLRPYVCLFTDEGRTTEHHGWVCPKTTQWYDHCNCPVHDDHERVVAWRRITAPINFLYPKTMEISLGFGQE